VEDLQHVTAFHLLKTRIDIVLKPKIWVMCDATKLVELGWSAQVFEKSVFELLELEK
jgi:hypothetical protein